MSDRTKPTMDEILKVMGETGYPSAACVDIINLRRDRDAIVRSELESLLAECCHKCERGDPIDPSTDAHTREGTTNQFGCHATPIRRRLAALDTPGVE